MTPSQQAELEQVAREWVAQHELVFKGDVRSLITLLAAQRAKVLAEVAGETRRFTSAGAVAQWCRQQAKERS